MLQVLISNNIYSDKNMPKIIALIIASVNESCLYFLNVTFKLGSFFVISAILEPFFNFEKVVMKNGLSACDLHLWGHAVWK